MCIYVYVGVYIVYIVCIFYLYILFTYVNKHTYTYRLLSQIGRTAHALPHS